MVSVERRDTIAIAWLDDGQNLLNGPSLAALDTALSAALRDAAAVVIASRSRWWCNGVDLAWARSGPENAGDALLQALSLLASRLLSAPVPVVAALTGHAYGGGLLLAMACDYRVAAAGKGWFCLPAAALNVHLPPPLVDMLRRVLGPGSAAERDVILRGLRFDARGAQHVGMVDVVCDDHAPVVDRAVELAQQLASKPAFAFYKQLLNEHLVAQLTTPWPARFVAKL